MKIFVGIYVVFFAFACKKDQESELWTEVHVTAKNYITGEPINDVLVGVYERKNKSFSLETELTVLKEEMLTNGKFDFGWYVKKRCLVPKFNYSLIHHNHQIF